MLSRPPLQIPAELQLPGSQPHSLSIKSNQWDWPSAATDLCRCSIHGSSRCPLQVAGHQNQTLPAPVSRRTGSLLSALLCLWMLSSAAIFADDLGMASTESSTWAFREALPLPVVPLICYCHLEGTFVNCRAGIQWGNSTPRKGTLWNWSHWVTALCKC